MSDLRTEWELEVLRLQHEALKRAQTKIHCDRVASQTGDAFNEDDRDKKIPRRWRCPHCYFSSARVRFLRDGSGRVQCRNCHVIWSPGEDDV